jgi:hypothetical protein
MIGGAGVCGTAEEVRNLIVNRKKSLGLPEGFEALHDPLASPPRLMAVFRAIV